MKIIVCFLRNSLPLLSFLLDFFFICNPCSKIFNYIEAFQFCFKVVVSITRPFISFKKLFFVVVGIFFFGNESFLAQSVILPSKFECPLSPCLTFSLRQIPMASLIVKFA
jgi:hypothetical protein